jgi:hypothetical protein
LTFIDANANGVVDGGELVVKQADPLPMGLTATPGAGFVTFNARGQATALTIGICQSGYVGRNIDIKSTGHASVVEPAVTCP